MNLSKKLETFTLEEVALHNSPKDLWVIMNRRVYDLTRFHKFHPGGSAVILQMAGKDATAAANAAHKTLLPGNLMKEFCIGNVKMSSKAIKKTAEAVEVQIPPPVVPRPVVRTNNVASQRPKVDTKPDTAGPRVYEGCPPQGNESGNISELRKAKGKLKGGSAQAQAASKTGRRLSNPTPVVKRMAAPAAAAPPAKASSAAQSSNTPSTSSRDQGGGTTPVQAARPPQPVPGPPNGPPRRKSSNTTASTHVEYRQVGIAAAEMKVEHPETDGPPGSPCPATGTAAGAAEAALLVESMIGQAEASRQEAWKHLEDEINVQRKIWESLILANKAMQLGGLKAQTSNPDATSPEAKVEKELLQLLALSKTKPTDAVKKLEEMMKRGGETESVLNHSVREAVKAVASAEHIASSRKKLVDLFQAFEVPAAEELEALIAECGFSDAKEVYNVRRVLCWKVVPLDSWPELEQPPKASPIWLTGPPDGDLRSLPKSPASSESGRSRRLNLSSLKVDPNKIIPPIETFPTEEAETRSSSSAKGPAGDSVPAHVAPLNGQAHDTKDRLKIIGKDLASPCTSPGRCSPLPPAMPPSLALDPFLMPKMSPPSSSFASYSCCAVMPGAKECEEYPDRADNFVEDGAVQRPWQREVLLMTL